MTVGAFQRPSPATGGLCGVSRSVHHDGAPTTSMVAKAPAAKRTIPSNNDGIPARRQRRGRRRGVGPRCESCRTAPSSRHGLPLNAATMTPHSGPRSSVRRPAGAATTADPPTRPTAPRIQGPSCPRKLTTALASQCCGWHRRGVAIGPDSEEHHTRAALLGGTGSTGRLVPRLPAHSRRAESDPHPRRAGHTTRARRLDQDCLRTGAQATARTASL